MIQGDRDGHLGASSTAGPTASARTLIDRGAAHQDKVAQYLYNCPEYLESMFAAFKAGLVPVNTNYRYADDELLYLWDNADAVCVVFHGIVRRAHRGHPRPPAEGAHLAVGRRRQRALPRVGHPLRGRPPPPRPTGSSPPWGRGDDDLLLMYTGGTTGMPKGVMWRQDSLVKAVVSSVEPALRRPGRLRRPARAAAHRAAGRRRCCPCPPLMHGTGQFTTFISLSGGGVVVLLESRHFDVDELLDTIEARQVNSLIIVGDAFAKPMVRALDANPGRWDLSSLVIITSSGVMWSEPVKQGLLAPQPEHATSSTCSPRPRRSAWARRCRRASPSADTAKFTLGENARVITDDGHDVVPGIGRDRPGGGQGPPARSGTTRTRRSRRPRSSSSTATPTRSPATTPRSRPTARLTLLGRGSVCINTGGEKVYPEEVEEILKEHPTVQDAVAVGLPDDKFGEIITAVVQAAPGGTIDDAELIAWVKSRLASFKAPKRVVPIDTIGRGPNGKVDYKRMKGYAADQLGVTLPA